MKRRSTDGGSGDDPVAATAAGGGEEEGEDTRRKKKMKGVQVEEEVVVVSAAVALGEDLLFEVLRRADATTLGRAACVCRSWRRMAEDERLWEVIYDRHWARMGCGERQVRSVVLPLGGFRRLYSRHLLPILRQPSSSSSSSSSSLHPILPFSAHNTTTAATAPSTSTAPPPTATVPWGQGKRADAGPRIPSKWGKDEVLLSLCLLSTKHYAEKIGIGKKGGGGSSGDPGSSGGGGL